MGLSGRTEGTVMPSGDHMTRKMEEDDPTEEEIWGVPGGDPGLAYKIRMERKHHMVDADEVSVKQCAIRTMPAGTRAMQRDF